MILPELDRYIALLKEYNTHTNIYSANAYDKLQFHIEDSVNILKYIPKNTRQILDIGSGSGLPAIPLAIGRRDIHVTAIESKSRKTKFLISAKSALGLENLTVITSDIHEYIAQCKPMPQVITAKAFAPIDRLLPILKTLAQSRATVIIPISETQELGLKRYHFPPFISENTIRTDSVHTYLIMTLKKTQ